MAGPAPPVKSALGSVALGHPTMAPDDLKRMSIDQLWALHTEITAVLVRRMSAEKRQLERRLQELRTRRVSNVNPSRERRPYPQVFPKFRNPANPSETWAGRGKQPRWLTAQLTAGRKLDDFRIHPSSGRKRRSASR
jgi:DNA-binding protein H-NS